MTANDTPTSNGRIHTEEVFLDEDQIQTLRKPGKAGDAPAPYDGAEERRRTNRQGFECDVTCHFGNGDAVAARAKDISVGGMFVLADHPVEYGTHVTIFAVLPDPCILLKLPSVVRWHRKGGFGVQFAPLCASDADAIAGYRAEGMRVLFER